ncbi:MAG: hypothetical protein ACM3NV_11220 [Syntrophothermus sp.]
MQREALHESGRRADVDVPALAAGDRRRLSLRRAVLAAMVSGLALVALVGSPKLLPWLYAGAPWAEDPYDAVVSFAIFFVPLSLAWLSVHVALCRRRRDLPVSRAVGVARGSRLLVWLVGLTCLACWVAVATRSSGPPLLLVGLMLTTLTVVAAVAALVRIDLDGLVPEDGADWAADALALIAVLGSSGGGGGRLRELLPGLEARLLPALRRHPVALAAVLATALGFAVGLGQAVREGYGVGAALLTAALLAAGLFAFLSAAGSYLRILASSSPARGARRRLTDACVCACAVAVLSVACRGALWPLIGESDRSAGFGALAELVSVAAAAALAVVFAVESALGLHAGRSDSRRPA